MVSNLFLLAAADPQFNEIKEIKIQGPPIGLIIFMVVFILAINIIMIASYWKIYTKAGKPGWACLVPIYNLIVLLEIVGKPVWWILLLLIPCVNIIILIMLVFELARVFGKDGGFAVGMLLLGIIFYPILAFGSATYQGPGHRV